MMNKYIAIALLLFASCTPEDDYCPCVETVYQKEVRWELMPDFSSVRHIDTVIVSQKNVKLQSEYYQYMGSKFKTVQCFKTFVK